MLITVHLFGSLQRFSQPDTPGIRKMDVPKGSRVEDLIKMLKTKDREVVASAINSKTCSFDKELQDGVDVFLITALGGG